MKKNIIKFLAILIAAILVGVVFNLATGKSAMEIDKGPEKSIYIKDSDGKIVKQASADSIFITVKKNDMIVSGTATGDISVHMADKVENLTIENLNQGDYKIEILTSEKANVDVVFKGENRIYSLSGFNDITVNGASDSDVLIATEEIGSPEKVEISSGIIKTGVLFAYEGMKITGNPKIYLENTFGAEFAELDIMETLTMDFEEGGILQIKDDLQNDMPAYIEKLELGDNTKITVPQNGYLKLDHRHDSGLNQSIIFDEEGNRAKGVTIEYAE